MYEPNTIIKNNKVRELCKKKVQCLKEAKITTNLKGGVCNHMTIENQQIIVKLKIDALSSQNSCYKLNPISRNRLKF